MIPGVQEPTWARLGAENAPRTHFHRSGVVFVDFGTIWEGFWKDVGRMLDKCWMDFFYSFFTDLYIDF